LALPDPAAALDRWIGLLAPGGTLILVEGRWHTGDGLVADELLPLVASRTSAVSVRHLPEPTFWGREISDERYLVSARA